MLTRQRRISNIWSTIETSHTLPADPIAHCIYFARHCNFHNLIISKTELHQLTLTFLTAMYSAQCTQLNLVHTIHFTMLDTLLCSIKCTVEYRQTAALCKHCALLFSVQWGPELPLLGSRWTIHHPHILVAFHGQHFSTLRSHMDGRIPIYQTVLKHHWHDMCHFT